MGTAQAQTREPSAGAGPEPDRSLALPTEGISARYADVDLWPTRDAVAAMLEGQLAAAAAVAAQAGPLAAAAEAAAARLADPAGRLVYVGAGASGRIAIQDGVELGPTYDWPAERLVYALAGARERWSPAPKAPRTTRSRAWRPCARPRSAPRTW